MNKKELNKFVKSLRNRKDLFKEFIKWADAECPVFWIIDSDISIDPDCEACYFWKGGGDRVQYIGENAFLQQLNKFGGFDFTSYYGITLEETLISSPPAAQEFLCFNLLKLTRWSEQS